MQAGASLLEKLRDRRIGRGRLEKLDARIRRGQHGDVDFFGGDGFAMFYIQANAFIELNCRFQRLTAMPT